MKNSFFLLTFVFCFIHAMEMPQDQPSPPYHSHLGKFGRLPSDLLVKVFSDPFDIGKCECDTSEERENNLKMAGICVLKLLGASKTTYQDDIHLTQKLAMGIKRSRVMPMIIDNDDYLLALTLLGLPTPASMKLMKQVFKKNPAQRKEFQNRFWAFIEMFPKLEMRTLLDFEIIPDTNAKTTILDISVQKIKLLFIHPKGPSVNSITSLTGGNALHLLVRQYSETNKQEVVHVAQVLLKKGINYKKTDNAGFTPLAYAKVLQAEGMITLLQARENEEKSGCMGIM